MNLLEKYIRLLLAEGRLEDVRNKYFNNKDLVNNLSSQDPSGNNKYLLWMTRQVVYGGENEASVIDLVNKFHKNTQRLKGDKKDLYKYNSLSDLGSELSKVSDSSKRQQKKAVKKQGADIVFENDEVVVLIPKTHKASCYYGSNTKWCTAWKNNSSHFEKYLGEVTLYYILPKDGGEKVAVAVGEGDSKEVFDSKDNEKNLSWLKGKLQQYNIPSSIFKYVPFTGMIRKDDGTILWYLNGLLHRTDGPAIETPGGLRSWYLNGERHREDGPAIEWADGTKEWWLNGKLHRKDGPAIEDSDESKKWYLNGKLHRTDGPAIEWFSGIKEWYLKDKRHSESRYWQEVGLDKKEEYYKGLKK